MEQMFDEGRNIRPSQHSFNHAIVTWTRSGAENTAENIKLLFDKMRSRHQSCLDLKMFETALHGLSHNTNGDREMAKGLVEELIALSKSKEELSLSNTCLNLALKAECQKANRNEKEMPAFGAHKLLYKYIHMHKLGKIDLLPDAMGFNTVISSWAQTPHNQAIHKAEEIFRTMIHLSRRKDLHYVKPDVYTYSNMLRVYANSRHPMAPQKAEMLVQKLEKDKSRSDSYVYNGVLNVWARNINPNKAVHARNWLDKMIKLQKTDKFSYNIVLKACYQTRGDDEQHKVALDIALRTYKEILSSEKASPDFITFASITKAVHFLCTNREERKKHLKQIFEECCDRGMLGDLVVKEMKQAIPKGDHFSFIGHDLQSPFEKHWTANL